MLFHLLVLGIGSCTLHPSIADLLLDDLQVNGELFHLLLQGLYFHLQTLTLEGLGEEEGGGGGRRGRRGGEMGEKGITRGRKEGKRKIKEKKKWRRKQEEILVSKGRSVGEMVNEEKQVCSYTHPQLYTHTHTQLY